MGLARTIDTLHDGRDEARNNAHRAPTCLRARGAVLLNGRVPSRGTQAVVPARTQNIRPMPQAILRIVWVAFLLEPPPQHHTANGHKPGSARVEMRAERF